MQRGFTLVELSIVLVILGLLTGGILAGQSLIRAAELRAVSSEYQRYSTAINSFRDKYFAVPGDFRDATKFWDRNVTDGWCVSNSGKAGPVATGACDGDGNGWMMYGAAGNQSGEPFQFWRHLALAGLIEGSYSGLAGANGVVDFTFGSNAPASKLSNAGWGSMYDNNLAAGSPYMFAVNYVNTLTLGADDDSWVDYPVIKPEEGWNIDTKVDDGKPARGTLHGIRGCTDSSSNTDFNANYLLNSSAVTCALIFRLQA